MEQAPSSICRRDFSPDRIWQSGLKSLPQNHTTPKGRLRVMVSVWPWAS